MPILRFSLIFFISLPLLTHSTISENFQNYIEKKFGAEAKRLIIRSDFGSNGSFGGGKHQASKGTRLVHHFDLSPFTANISAKLQLFSCTVSQTA
jgi:hypothetical protein